MTDDQPGGAATHNRRLSRHTAWPSPCTEIDAPREQNLRLARRRIRRAANAFRWLGRSVASLSLGPDWGCRWVCRPGLSIPRGYRPQRSTWPGPLRRMGGPGPLVRHQGGRLEENSECCLGWATAAHKARGAVKIDLDVRRQEQRRPDIEPGADKLVEPPPEDCFCFGFVDLFELSRSHSRSPSSRSAWCIRSRPNGATRPPHEVLNG